MKERIEVERAGEPFLVYREGGGQRIVPLVEGGGDMTIGREAESDVCLAGDEQVSVLHAELRRVGRQWLVVDDGLSRNGTYVNGERVHGRRRLRDRDQLGVGQTVLVFHEPADPSRTSTVAAGHDETPPELSPAQRRVLVALCRPFKDGAAYARPATNQQIADELVLTVAAVKTHLRGLYERFGVEHLPQNEKRAQLVHLALEGGVIWPADLEREP